MSFFHFQHFSENLDVARVFTDALSDYSINFVIFMVNTVKNSATLKIDLRLMGYMFHGGRVPEAALHITIKSGVTQEQRCIHLCFFGQITHVKRPQTEQLPWWAGGWREWPGMGRTFHIMFASISLVTIQRLSAIVRTTPLTSLPKRTSEAE
ncbi:hypothetical protein [Paenibacillus silvae]|uniref:hypothetical protein n=1 Tax=Paenibacillus silvae TaxID=1325358 RepID=UPI00200516CC|nr:hypothetical protein [Paenibacillus silvae]